MVVAEKPVVAVEDLPPGSRRGTGPGAGPWDDRRLAGRPAGSVVRPNGGARAARAGTAGRALAAAGGNKAEAARALGMARSTLLSRLKRMGLS